MDYLQRIITVGLPPAAAGINPFEATAAAATDWDSDAVYHDARSDMDSQPRQPDSGALARRIMVQVQAAIDAAREQPPSRCKICAERGYCPACLLGHNAHVQWHTVNADGLSLRRRCAG